MSAGMEIVNDHGSILIDSVNPCLVLTAIYTEANLDAGGQLRIWDATPETLIAYQGPWSTTNQYVQVHSPTDKSFWWIGINNTTAGVKFFRFEKITAPLFNVGLVLYNEAGQVTFDAMQKPGRVVAAINAPGAYTFPTGSYAIAFTQTHLSANYEVYDPEDGQGWLLNTSNYQTRGSISGNVVSYNPAYNFNNNTQRVPRNYVAPPNTSSGSGLALVLDVTNY